MLLPGLLVACASGEEAPAYPDAYVQPPGWDVALYERNQDSSSIIGPCARCDDQNPCTRDICLTSGGCDSEPEPKGTSCDDGNACTGNDRCDGAGQCTGDPATDIVYRYHHLGTDAYYYSRSATGGPQGYGFEKKLFRIRRQGDPQTVALYRLVSTKYSEFMLSVDANEAATWYQSNGVIGGIFPKQQPGTVPLYRLKRNVTVLRHLTTLDAQELAGSFAMEMTQGYVCPL